MKTKSSDTPLGRKVLRGLAVGAGASSLRLVIQLVLQAVLARLLVPEDFGVVALAVISVSFAERIMPLGINFALTQRTTSSVQLYQTGATILVVVSSVSAALFYIGSSHIARFFNSEVLTVILQSLCILFPLKVLTKLHTSFLQRQLRFNTLVSAQLASYILGYGVVSLILAIAGAGAWALICALIGQTVVLYGLVALLSRLELRPRFRIDEAKQIFKLGGGFLLATIGNFFALQIDNMVVGKYFPAETLGFYGRAYQIITLPSTLFDAVVQQVLFPSLSKLQNDKERMRSAFLRGSALIATVAFTASGLLFFLAGDLINIMLGDGWEPAIPLLQILSVGLGPRTCYKIADTISSSSGAVYRRALLHWLYAGLVAIGAIVGSYWGIDGIAVGVTAALFGAYFLAHSLCLDVLELSFRDLAKIHLPALSFAALVTIPCAGLTYFCHQGALPSVITVTVVGLASLLVALLLFRLDIGFSPQSRNGVDTLVSSLKRRSKD